MVIPTEREFTKCCELEFDFLSEFGFVPGAGPKHRRSPYCVWFMREDISIVVSGEGYGTAASASFETASHRLAPIFLVPEADRPNLRVRRKEKDPGQLEQVSREASLIKQYCKDILEGDLSRFLELSKELPPYLLP